MTTSDSSLLTKNARGEDGRAALPGTQRAGEVAEQPVERRALLHAAGEVEAAQPRAFARRGRPDLSRAGAEDAVEEAHDARAQVDEARREGQRRAAPDGSVSACSRAGSRSASAWTMSS